jgi:putative transposase
VILRGVDRTAIFFAHEDNRYFLDKLAELAATESVAVHAYMLMTNHVHLLMTPETEDGLAKLMKGVGQRYVQYINRTHRRTGTLFEGRFRSSLVEADSYLFACQRYIELNPVRATMVEGPGNYPWSSYGANALGIADALITPHSLYHELGESDEQRQAAYRGLFEDAFSGDLLQRIRDTVNGGFVLGNAQFERQIAVMLGRRTWRGSPGRPKKGESDAKQLDLYV